MDKQQKNFLILVITTVVILAIGLLVPNNIAMLLSVVYFTIVTWLKPKLLLPMLIIYFPLRPFLVEINDGLNLAGDIGILILVVKVLFDAVKQKEYKSIFKLEWYEWAYLFFCAVGAISALFTGVTLVAIVFQLRKFLVMYLLYYGLKRLTWERQEIIILLKLITGVALVLILHGFVEKLSQRQWLLPQAWAELFISPTNAERIYGLIGNPNSLGLFMFVSIVASFILLRTTHQKRWYIPLILSVGTLLLTLSRGTWIGIFIAGLVFLIISKKKGLLKQVFIAGIAGYVLVFLPIDYADQMISSALKDEPQTESEDEVKEENDGGGSLSDRISSSINKETVNRSTNTGRLFYIKKGFEVLKDYPVIGTGFGTFGDSAALVYSSPIYDDYGLANIYEYRDKGGFYSDNQYIQIMVQTGIIGTILFAIFLLNMLYRIWTARKVNRDVANVAILFWLFICIVGAVYNIWENQVFPMFFFALIAFLEIAKKRINGKSRN